MPPDLPVRPTTDMAKEALFNILNNHFDFQAIKVLDLFSGTGSIAFEFASRGALEVVAVDNNLRCFNHINNTAKLLQYGQMAVVKADAFSFINSCRSNFDIVFADPPYDMTQVADIPDMIFGKKLIADDGWLIIEHPSNIQFANHPNFKNKRNYSKVHFSFFA